MSDEKSPNMGHLMDETRIVGGSRMIKENTPALAITREVAQQVSQKIRQWAEEHRRSMRAIARDIGVSPSTLSQVLSDDYAGDWQSVIQDLDKWLEGEAKRDAMPRVAQFVRTKVALEIETVADLACAGQTIGLVIGDSGIGKTLALQAIADSRPGAIMITLNNAHSSSVALLWSIVEAANIAAKGTPHNRGENYVFGLVAEKLRDTNRLLIVDEVHAALESRSGKGLHTLRYLFDATGSPQLWSSTVDLIAKLRQGEASGRQPLEQIRRRIGVRHDLMARCDPAGGGEPLFTIEEVRQVFARAKMRLSSDGSRYLMRLANLPKSGALGACVVLMNLVVRANSSRAEIVTAEMIQQMMRYTEFRREYDMLSAQMELRDRPIAKVG